MRYGGAGGTAARRLRSSRAASGRIDKWFRICGLDETSERKNKEVEEVEEVEEFDPFFERIQRAVTFLT